MRATTATAVGPRTRRRLAFAGIVLALVAGVALGSAVLGRSSHAARSATSATDNGPSLVYGMTRQQVRQITGSPTKTSGNCWFFTPQNGMVGRIPMANTYPAGAHEGYLRLCFVAGLFSSAARQTLASEMTASPFPGGSTSTPSPAGWTWTAWVQNPERGSCRVLPSACVAK